MIQKNYVQKILEELNKQTERKSCVNQNNYEPIKYRRQTTLLTNKILDSDEVEFLRTLYSKTVLTVGNQKGEINKGIMEGSIISLALFNIFIEKMLKLLNREFNIEDIFVYADDIC